MSRDTSHRIRLPKALSNLALNTSRDGVTGFPCCFCERFLVVFSGYCQGTSEQCWMRVYACTWEVFIHLLLFQSLCWSLAIYCFPVAIQGPWLFLRRQVCAEIPSLCTDWWFWDFVLRNKIHLFWCCGVMASFSQEETFCSCKKCY